MISSDNPNRSIFSGFIVVTLLTFILISVIAVFMNGQCQSRFWENQLVYPGALLLDQQSAFLGMQRVVYQSADSPFKVDQWYTIEYARQSRARVQNGDFSGVPLRSWTIEAAAQGGSSITLAVMCPSGTPF